MVLNSHEKWHSVLMKSNAGGATVVGSKLIRANFSLLLRVMKIKFYQEKHTLFPNFYLHIYSFQEYIVYVRQVFSTFLLVL